MFYNVLPRSDMMAKTQTQIGIRVTNDFKARLERQADKERRSVSNLILKVMEEYLEQQEKQS
jgi:predicted transcriptional regulator